MIRAIARFPVPATIEYVPSPIGTAVENTIAIQAALDRLGAAGGGILQLPPGVIPYTANPATQVAPNEGMAWHLQAQHSNIAITGAGKGITILKPASNKVEGFVQNGASNLLFRGMTFDNAANGALQLQVAPSVRGGPGTGVAGQGNGANTAIRQYEGADLTVRNCSFYDFIIAISYIGSFANMAVLVGTVVVEGCDFDACIQGLIPEQPAHVRMTNCRYDNGVESVNFGGSNDPGHGIYLSNRPGAFPHTVIVDNFQGINNWAELVKVRKGRVVTCSNLAVEASHRGIEFENCELLTVTNCSIRLADILPADNNGAAVFLADNGVSEFGNIVMDTSATDAWGFRVANGASANPWANRRMHVHDCSQINDLSGGNFSKDWNIFVDQDDLRIENFTAHLSANIANNNPIINVTGGARPIIRNVSRRAEGVGSPVGSDRLIEFGAGVTDARVTFNRTNLSTAPTALTVNDLGTNTTILRDDGVQSSTYLPVASFVTNGDFVPTYSRQQGYWTKTGDIVHAFVSVIFNCNAYTTAAGNFQISLPFITAGSGTMAAWAVAVGNFQNIVFGTGTDIEIIVAASVNPAQAFLRTSFTANAGAYLGVTTVPASATNIAVSFQITYKIVET